MLECLDGLLQLKDLLKMGEIDIEFFKRSIDDIYNKLERINTECTQIRNNLNGLKEEIDEGEHGRSTIDSSVNRLDNFLAPII